MKRPTRRIRRNTKGLDALKSATLIVGVLVAGIFIVWLVAQFLHPKDPDPDLTPQPGQSMWDAPPSKR